MIDPRQEGVYCHWETYPPESPVERNNILVIEHVWGDGSVTRFQCSAEESDTIREFLR